MKKLIKLDKTNQDILDACIEGITGNNELLLRFSICKQDLISEFERYEELAIAGNLLSIVNDFERKFIKPGKLEKDDLSKVYTQYFAAEDKPARKLYDEIRGLSSECPYCGFGEVYQVDHFFPKDKYQQFSVFPGNLIPICGRCNFIKGSKEVCVNGSHIIQPYYDDVSFFNEQWIFATFDQKEEVFTYNCHPPKSWSIENINNAYFHFELFRLAERYSVKAASRLSDILNFYVINDISEILDLNLDYPTDDPNHWEHLMFQALYTAPPKHGESSECPRCKGKGKILGINCDICNGAGLVGYSKLNSLNGRDIIEDFECNHNGSSAESCEICGGKGVVAYEKAIQM